VSPTPRLYTEFTDWWALLTAPADYAEEAEVLARLLTEGAARPVRTVLELGSGGGNNASHLKRRFELTLSDNAPAMLAVSRALNPECEHLPGDMRELRLGREFDGVVIHDAVMYMTTEADLRAALATAFAHCRPGGRAVFAPDCVAETFRPETKHGGHDGADGRALRYLEWTRPPAPGATVFVTDFAMLLREPGGPTRLELDEHVMGLFPRAVWLAALRDAGFEPRVDTTDPFGRELFVGQRPE